MSPSSSLIRRFSLSPPRSLQRVFGEGGHPPGFRPFYSRIYGAPTPTVPAPPSPHFIGCPPSCPCFAEVARGLASTFRIAVGACRPPGKPPDATPGPRDQFAVRVLPSGASPPGGRLYQCLPPSPEVSGQFGPKAARCLAPMFNSAGLLCNHRNRSIWSAGGCSLTTKLFLLSTHCVVHSAWRMSSLGPATAF